METEKAIIKFQRIEHDSVTSYINRDDLWVAGAPHGTFGEVISRLQETYRLSEEQIATIHDALELGTTIRITCEIR